MRFTHKQIWVITFPLLVSLLMEHLINMTDTAFLGRVGEVELGASALAGVYYMAIYMLAFGFSIGAQILIGRRNGEGNYKDIGPILYKVCFSSWGLPHSCSRFPAYTRLRFSVRSLTRNKSTWPRTTT